MEYQDWSPVVLRKTGAGRMSQEDKQAAVKRAVQVGSAVSERKFAAGENKSAHAAPAGAGALRKLEDDTETFAHATVSTELKLALQQARLAKKMTQKDLAQAIAEKPTVINEYESGRAIPNPAILSKIERVLGVRLPRAPKKK